MSDTLPRILRPSNAEGLAPGEDTGIRVQDMSEMDERVGAEIKGLRKARGMTLAELAQAAGLSKGHLSQVERGISSPSVKALHSISVALGVTVSWFFPRAQQEDSDLTQFVVRAGARRALRYKSGIVDELLSPTLEGEIELLRCIFPPGAKSGEEFYSHQGEESGIVISGRLDLWVNDRHIVLQEGDSFAFKSDQPHRYENRGRVETIVIWAVTPPTY
ncbi:helix-turn-helix domain-containing protein [Hwanghaeella sp.]|uniref:helix-turn-helix domain-containing protein n=1 Tax=Hwanghaeella sp. TaxID=2605943 RepID=UPI003CCB9B5C